MSYTAQTASIVLGLAKDPDDKFRWISTGLDITDSNWLQLTLTSIGMQTIIFLILNFSQIIFPVLSLILIA